MNIKELKEILEIFENSKITEMDLERQGVRISLKKNFIERRPEVVIEAAEETPGPGAGTEPGGETDAPEEEGVVAVRTPMVGTFYSTASPDAEPFVEAGDHVGEGDVICIIEAMKLMNEIKSEVAGTVLKVLAENGQAVEFNQPLFLVRVD